MAMHSSRRRRAPAVSACLLQLLVHRARAWVAAVPAQCPPRAPFSREGRYAAPADPGKRPSARCAATSWPLFAAAAAAAAAAPDTSAAPGPSKQQDQQQPRSARRAAVGSNNLQSVDFTTALLMSRELEQSIVPARVENAYQMDAHNVALQLRTLDGNMWLHVCWHPKGAR